jgi:predicted nucleic acid-binding protein
MILADTPAWVEYDRATGSAVHRRVAELIASNGPLSVTQPVIMEVLAGARSDLRELDLRRLLLRSDTSRLMPLRTSMLRHASIDAAVPLGLPRAAWWTA